VFKLGEFEGNAQATEEYGYEGASVAKGLQTEVVGTARLHRFREFHKRLRDGGERRSGGVFEGYIFLIHDGYCPSQSSTTYSLLTVIPFSSVEKEMEGH
ncbi:hypothetical protein U1Q18_029542, partial [Sarracenia purpurea var. burkii]